VAHEVVFAPEALGDLRALYDVIALDAGTGRAQSYTDRIIAHCLGLVNVSGARHAPRRSAAGSAHHDIAPPRYHRVSHHRHDRAIDRILYGGRDLPTIFDEDHHD
jgi:plasmid stabilization system protein ParE